MSMTCIDMILALIPLLDWDHTNRALIEYNKFGYESALLTYAVT